MLQLALVALIAYNVVCINVINRLIWIYYSCLILLNVIEFIQFQNNKSYLMFV